MKTSAIAAALLLAAMPAAAQMAAPEGASPVIPNDGSPVNTQGSIQGYNHVNYRIQVEPGETVSVNFTPDFDKCYFNVTDPNGQLVYWSGKGGNSYSGTPQAAGEYTIKVFLKDNSARKGKGCNYNIAFSAQK